jgi:hypothetical protein
MCIWTTANWKSTTEPPSGRTAISRWAGETGSSSAATRAAEQRRFCGPSSRHENAMEWSRSPGFATCSPASTLTRSAESRNYCRITGSRCRRTPDRHRRLAGLTGRPDAVHQPLTKRSPQHAWRSMPHALLCTLSHGQRRAASSHCLHARACGNAIRTGPAQP